MTPSEILDPVVERVRAAREALARQCDYDVDRMLGLLESMQAEHPERVRCPADISPAPTNDNGHRSE
jgi:hypothetical protein